MTFFSHLSLASRPPSQAFLFAAPPPLFCCIEPSHLFSSLWMICPPGLSISSYLRTKGDPDTEAFCLSCSFSSLFHCFQNSVWTLPLHSFFTVDIILLSLVAAWLFHHCLWVLTVSSSLKRSLTCICMWSLLLLAVVLSKAIMSGRAKNNKWYIPKNFTVGRLAKELCRNYV